jgi:hypothetical protein
MGKRNAGPIEAPGASKLFDRARASCRRLSRAGFGRKMQRRNSELLRAACVHFEAP